MQLKEVGLGLVGAVGLVSVVLAAAVVWLALTDPISVANAVSESEVTPFIRDLAAVLMAALQGLLRYL
jgi:hypothetical protein